MYTFITPNGPCAPLSTHPPSRPSKTVAHPQTPPHLPYQYNKEYEDGQRWRRYYHQVPTLTRPFWVKSTFAFEVEAYYCFHNRVIIIIRYYEFHKISTQLFSLSFAGKSPHVADINFFA